jgi:hypothetical protein
MSYHVFFALSSGLKTPLKVPAGTLAAIIAHVAHIEEVMGIQRERYPDNPGVPERWKTFQSFGANLKDEEFCREAAAHNAWVINIYENFGFWAKHPFTIGKGHQDTGPNRCYPTGTKAEVITPKQADQFWCALNRITVPPDRWDKDYYRARMEHLYEVLRGRPSEGVSLDEKPLTIRQAAQVINLFSEFLDPDELRLDVPNGHDRLKSSYDGGYTWCEKCGPVDEDDFNDCVDNCRKRKCPLRAEFGEKEHA